MRPVSDRRARVFRQMLAAISVLMCGLAVTPALAQEEPGENEGFLAAKGRATYRIYCANCHGAEADGKGNIAKFLTVQPADLTRLSERNGGEFPTERVRRVIDGREQVPVHGRREMPIWGEVFQTPLVASPGDESEEERAQRKIREVITYLKSIQRRKGTEAP